MDRCPRCAGDFQCGIGGAAPCACTGIRLSAALQAQLRAHYTGCLCLRCLIALAAGAPVLPDDGDTLDCGASEAPQNRPTAPAAEDHVP